MEPISLRRLVPEDRPRILEISSQIWDGHDWVPGAFDEWLADPAGETVAAEWAGVLIGFARRTWLHPSHAWFEGIRTDPAHRGKGAGRAITEHLIEGARRDGTEKIHLSTHIDNEASIHIIESYGFERVASFVYLEGRPVDTPPEEIGPEIVPVREEEAAWFVDRSAFLELAQRRFPRGWRFFPFDVDPLSAVARLETRMGIRRDGALVALACARQSVDGTGPVTLNFADGAPDDVRRLLGEMHRRYAGRTIETMVPKQGDQEAALLAILRELDYETWHNYAAAVFVYELALR